MTPEQATGFYEKDEDPAEVFAWFDAGPHGVTAQNPQVEVVELTREESRALFDRHARELLGISGEEFLRRYDAGELDECAEEVVQLRMIIPFAREAEG